LVVAAGITDRHFDWGKVAIARQLEANGHLSGIRRAPVEPLNENLGTDGGAWLKRHWHLTRWWNWLQSGRCLIMNLDH
jgi:hypothetical protein